MKKKRVDIAILCSVYSIVNLNKYVFTGFYAFNIFAVKCLAKYLCNTAIEFAI